jgi:tetratricopeptide (TPR) repeat protein
MTNLQDRINQFRKMANDDPDNELGHYRLGQLLMEAGDYQEAISSLKRTLELSPQFAKVYQLLASCYLQLNERPEAVRVLQEGYGIADEAGHFMPRDEMARMLQQLGEAVPAPRTPTTAGGPAEGGGFRCQRPGCFFGARARPLASPPFNDDLGRRIQANICAECWNEWLKQYSIKVINELRLDLSTEAGQAEYDRYMNGFFGFEESGSGQQGLSMAAH